MRETFVVRWDGLNPCLQSSDLAEWPRDYRLGLAFGLWLSPEGHLTLNPRSVSEGLTLLDPIADAGPALAEMVEPIAAVRPPGGLTGNFTDDLELVQSIRRRAPLRPREEADALGRLAELLQPEPPF
jgi:hypothetical protein